jgi:Fe-S cluster assembly protein SufD
MSIAVDLSPRTASLDPEAFSVPTGREEEWRFSPIERILPFTTTIVGAGNVLAEESEFIRNVAIAELDSAWLPTDRVAAIARASVTQAVIVTIPNDAVIQEPIVVHLRGQAPQSYMHVEIRAGRFSQATIVLEHDTTVDIAGAVVVDAGDGAHLTVVSVLDGQAESAFLVHWASSLGRDATYKGCQVTLAGKTVRILPSVTYRAPGGKAELLGVFLADQDQYFEHRIFVNHEEPHCSSNVTYKGALSGANAHTVWVGDVLVRRTAIGIDTYELNRNLLLNDGPRADSVPNLELETGDVAGAGHASATGRFDDEQLFYLQARGIPEHIARKLVVHGFFADVLGRIGNPAWRDTLMERIDARLGATDVINVGIDDD